MPDISTPGSHLLLSSVTSLDALVSYLTDIQPVLHENKAWIASRHRDGDTFATQVIKSCEAIVDDAARNVKEHVEAVQATEAQTEAMARGEALIRKVRNQGSYIADELARSDSAQDRQNARRVRVACGVGSRINLKRQTGVRKMLTLQGEGLRGIKDLWIEWKGDPETHDRLLAALREIEDAIRKQSKEKVEADTAQDVLEEAAQFAVTTVNRALRLINANAESAPTTLHTALASLQTTHTSVFWAASGTADDPAEPDPPPATPAAPTA